MDSAEGITGPINLGNPGEFTIKELAELVIEMTGSKSVLTYLPLPADDPKQRQPNIEQAKSLLDWQPTISLADGLRHTVGYFDRLLSKGANESRANVRN
jgi:UDP-glucuronate decarboxylase